MFYKKSLCVVLVAWKYLIENIFMFNEQYLLNRYLQYSILLIFGYNHSRLRLIDRYIMIIISSSFYMAHEPVVTHCAAYPDNCRSSSFVDPGAKAQFASYSDRGADFTTPSLRCI